MDTEDKPTRKMSMESVFEGIEAGRSKAHQEDEESWTGTESTATGPWATRDRLLSEISKQYDRGNKGYLDEEERELRRMDSRNLGHIDTNKALRLLHDLKDAQKTNVTNRKIIIALSIFAILLALSNVGTSFAAAILAKDSDVEDGQLVSKATGKRIAMTPRQILISLEEDRPTDGNGRLLQEKNTTITKTKAIEIFNELCSNVPANLVFAQSGPHGQSSSWACSSTGDIQIQMVHCGSQQVITYSFVEQLPTLSADMQFLSVYFTAIRGGTTTGVYGIKCPTNTLLDTCVVGNVAPPITTTELYCTSPCYPFGNCSSAWFCPETQVCDYDPTNCGACKYPTA